MRQLSGRLAGSLLLLLALSLGVFLLAQIAPGEPYDALRADPRVSEATIEALKARAGLDLPLPQRYLRWLGNLASGDLGFSTAYGAPVASLLPKRLKSTLLLTLGATALAWALGLGLALRATSQPAGPLARAADVSTTVLQAIPDFLLALVALLLASASGLFPLGGTPDWQASSLSTPARLGTWLHHLALPTLVLALGQLPTIYRHARASLLEALEAPFVEAARARGIGPRRRLLHHALPAAANPLINLFGLSLSALVSGAILVEVIFAWPGIGRLMIDSIFARDLDMIQAILLISALFLVLGQGLADLMLHRLDPRIRMGVGRDGRERRS